MAGASSGGAFNAQQAAMTIIEHRKVNDLLRMWEERVHKQAQHFESFATQVLQYDTEIIANVGKIKTLRTEHDQLKCRQDAVDQSIQQIWEQQDSLGRLLTGLQESLKSKIPPEAPQARLHQQAKVLTVQLDELDRQAEELAKETKTVQSTLYTGPLTTAVQVLDAHASALDAIQTQASTVAQRLRVVESTL